MYNLNESNERIELLSVDQVCEMLGAKKPAVYALIKRKAFPAFKVGNSYRIPHEGLMNFISAAMNKPEEVPQKVFAGIRVIDDVVYIVVLVGESRVWFNTNYFVDEQGRFYEDRKRRRLEGRCGLAKVETPSKTVAFNTFRV